LLELMDFAAKDIRARIRRKRPFIQKATVAVHGAVVSRFGDQAPELARFGFRANKKPTALKTASTVIVDLLSDHRKAS
jgi:hypothetical protein